MQRTALHSRQLPYYTRSEEVSNMVSHIVGVALGFVALLTCVIIAARNDNVSGVVGGCIYGLMLILLFTMSSIYHGLRPGIAKKVFQVLDHCSIYLLIAGTYTPILTGKLFTFYQGDAILLLCVVWSIAIVGIILNSIDLKRFTYFSIISYIGMGWCIIYRAPQIIELYDVPFFAMLMAGGFFYTLGALFYGVGKKKRFMHFVFHIFVDVAALLNFLAIAIYIMPG